MAGTKFEHKVGARVGIIRARHGWYDGRVHGNVTKVNHRSGGAAYYIVEDDDGHEYEIYATKDLIGEN